MAYPPIDTAWATGETYAESVISKEGKLEYTLNKAEPSNVMKEQGIRSLTPAVRQYFNYWMGSVHLALDWHRKCEVGTILEFKDGTMTLAQVQQDRLGVWEDLGTETRNYSNTTTTVRAFRKIS